MIKCNKTALIAAVFCLAVTMACTTVGINTMGKNRPVTITIGAQPTPNPTPAATPAATPEVK